MGICASEPTRASLLPGPFPLFSGGTGKHMVLFLEERGREGERERNIDVWLPLMHPYWGPGMQPRHVP